MDSFIVYSLHMYSRKPWKLSLQAYLCYLAHIPSELRRFCMKALVGMLRSSITNVHHPTTSVEGTGLWSCGHTCPFILFKHSAWGIVLGSFYNLSAELSHHGKGGILKTLLIFPLDPLSPDIGKNFLQLLFKTLVHTGSWFAWQYQTKVKAFVFCAF